MTDNRTTELLRRLLDERGVEHYDGTESTLWLKDEHGYRASADELSSGRLSVHIWCDTPEQAIAATLGNHPTKSGCGYYTDRDDDGTHIMCDDCGGYIGTAEEIAATLGGGTCKLYPLSALDVTLNMLGQTEWGACSECGCAVPMDARFCNECGKAVER